MKTLWNLAVADSHTVDRLGAALGLVPEIARILVNRGISDPEAARLFMNPGLDQLPSPQSLDSLEPAAVRVAAAIVAGQRILVFGDYDADGVTATALLVDFLEQAGATVQAYIPDRSREGYGLQPRHIAEQAQACGCALIVTADCGTGSHAAIQEAQRCGIDVVITDHHLPDNATLPAATVVNPCCTGHPNALAPLAGVGVAFYLAIALRARLRRIGWWDRRPEPNLRRLCDLVAVGTVADMVPLVGVNRVLTRVGLQVMRETTRPGIAALMTASAVLHEAVDSQDIAFRLAPRLNAAGRLEHARIALDLLRCPDPAAAQVLAARLDGLNRQRRQLEAEIFDEALALLERDPALKQRHALVLADPGWHEGVIGIVAGRLAKRYHRPAVVLTGRDGLLTGSARSIAGLDICQAFQAVSTRLTAFGGHPMAAGLRLLPEQLAAFALDLEKAVRGLSPRAGLAPPLDIDAELDLDRATPGFLEALAPLAPFGSGNPEPLFAARDLSVRDARIVGQHHLRLTLCQADRPSARTVAGIFFNADPVVTAGQRLQRAAFRLGWNRFNGQRSVQIIIAEV